ncbi:MAG TPA: hypothetical protein VN633_00935 [Bryobacteraceae bacterium]|nr:hypothetical protein [Bryobacteraceae bacterium]
MARGWESKSVESQIESAADHRKAAAMAVPPSPDEIAHQCERASLELSRIRVMHDLEHATNPRYREQLEAALHYLESKLAASV